MCGFVGFTSKINSKETVLERMMERIIHRGPDMGGQYVTALRIDPASSGAVFLKPGTAVIDPPGSWLRRLVPNGLQWMALLAAGPVLAALWRLVDNKGYKTKE